MEILGSFLDEEWESLSQIFSNSENHDFLLQHCNGSSSSFFSSNSEIPSPTFFPSDQISQESSNTTEIDEALFFNIHGNADQHHNFDDTNTFDHQSMNFHSMDFNNAGFMLPADVLMEDFLCSKGENQTFETADSDSCQIKRKLSEAAADAEMQDQDNAPQNPKKKPRISRNAQKNKKGKKTVVQEKNNNEEEMMNINGGNNKQSCSSCSSEDDDSNASQELNEEMKNSNAKTRASRGSATDPQSLYARRRRERINERLKILQNLVPNGTKVDISTMLEEAVQYVKFLQLQIKLLSSDNMWMYAPLAYNGMDLSMYQNICPNLKP